MSSADYTPSNSHVINPRIVKTAGICGGNARIAGTRMAIWCLHASRGAGCSDERFLELYPWLTREDLLAAWQYVELNQDEIQQQIEDNMSAG